MRCAEVIVPEGVGEVVAVAGLDLESEEPAAVAAAPPAAAAAAELEPEAAAAAAAACIQSLHVNLVLWARGQHCARSSPMAHRCSQYTQL